MIIFVHMNEFICGQWFQQIALSDTRFEGDLCGMFFFLLFYSFLFSQQPRDVVNCKGCLTFCALSETSKRSKPISASSLSSSTMNLCEWVSETNAQPRTSNNSLNRVKNTNGNHHILPLRNLRACLPLACCHMSEADLISY